MDYSRMNPSYKPYNEPKPDVPEVVTTVFTNGANRVFIIHPLTHMSSTRNIFEVLITIAKLNSPVQFIY